MLLDIGNFSDNPNEEGQIRTSALLEGMSKLGYSVVNVGQRDLTLGYQAFTELTAGLSMSFVSTNIVRKDTGEPVFRPYEIIEVERNGAPPLSVAVTGVVRFSPIWQKAGPPGTNLGIARPADMLNRFMGEIREKADTVVVLAALSKEDARRLAEEVEGIDFILGAYGGMFNAREETVSNTRIYYCGNQGQRVGEARVYVDADRKVVNTSSFMHYLTSQYPEDDAMKAFVQTVTDKLNELKAAAEPAKVSRLETPGVPEESPFVGSAGCKSCHADAFAQWSATRHATAFASLVRDNRHVDDTCVGCHVTGFGETGGFTTLEGTPALTDVGCETCHGPGRTHAESKAGGYGRVAVAACISCHDREQSPDFDYYALVGKVAHRASGGR